MSKNNPVVPDCANCPIVHNLKKAVKLNEQIKELKKSIEKDREKLPLCAAKISLN